jgi:NAD(P)-dependent dehydrogenase (short-subunit alcohol dehydrogenase family)
MGKVVALGFLKNKSRVFIADADQSRLDQFKKEEPAVLTALCDITDPEQIDRLFAAVDKELGGLDILMNNTGIGGPWGPIEDAGIDAWHRMIAINLTGTFYLLRKAVPMLKAAGGGSIVLNASTSGYMASPLSSPYAASKFGVIGLAKSLAVELGGYGIRVNTVCPGPVYSTRQEERMQAQAKAEGIAVSEARERYFMKYALSLSLPTVIDPEDIANMVLFICSDSAGKVTGQTLAVDGDTQTLIEPPPASLLLQADPNAEIPQTAGRYLEEAKARFHARFAD